MRHVLLALLVSSPALADPTLECSDAGSQVEIGSCVGAMEERVNQALEASYGFAMQAAKELDDVTGRVVAQPALEASQIAWVSYRDAQCEAVGASFGGGSGTGIAITSCRVDLGRVRVDQLLRFAN
ncbi:lysozyme inhibitor LprI family protein [Ruegeria lacuscaerulensis]|uniref:lysozyme inhibitor LprI family protein n=1 Tax=Ruegeria lacuscaerulensis TaxID=55218 RepID=UPI0014808870|nr:lysozyme inhibitor LprI family protein [Ruegeria lacuscaerulensis]